MTTHEREEMIDDIIRMLKEMEEMDKKNQEASLLSSSLLISPDRAG